MFNIKKNSFKSKKEYKEYTVMLKPSIIDRYLVKEYIFPLIASIITITFIFSIDFLATLLDSVFQKGLDAVIVLQFFFLNLAWILALAVPMAVLISSLMIFGRLSSDNEITALMSAGISPLRIMAGPIVFSIFIFGVMLYFQDRILPEANHQAAELGNDIKRANPVSMITENFIISDIPGYRLIIGKINYADNAIHNVRIFDEESNSVITAEKGKILMQDNVLLLILNNGEIIQDEKKGKTIEMSRLVFENHVITIGLPEMFQRTERTYRSDREMSVEMMQERIDGFESELENNRAAYRNIIKREFVFLNTDDSLKNFKAPLQRIPNERERLQKVYESIETHIRRYNRHPKQIDALKKSIAAFYVEIHKKYSLSFASIIFVLIGIPLGSIVRKRGMGVAIGSSFIIFVMYWAYLITGERLADGLIISPFIGMWGFNIILIFVGLFLIRLIINQNVTINFNFTTKFFKKNK